jgi:hypothetical protein
MFSRRLPRAWLTGIAAVAVMVPLSSALLIWWHGTAAVLPCADCNDVYQTILRRHIGDEQWRRTHVLLNIADGSRFIKSGVAQTRSRLPLFDRICYWYEFSSFLAQADGQPLSYSAVEGKGLRLIAPSERTEMLDRGTTVLGFSLPGFSFNHRRAMVFLWEERRASPRLAPSFTGSIIYLKKTGGRWAVDHPHGLGQLVVMS